MTTKRKTATGKAGVRKPKLAGKSVRDLNVKTGSAAKVKGGPSGCGGSSARSIW